MPFGDGTGPLGQGPRTGRGLGYCADYNRPGYANSGPGFGRSWFGRGRGRGWFGRGGGWGRWGYPPAPATPGEEKEMLMDGKKALREEAKALTQELTEIEKRIGQLEKGPSK